MFLKNSSLFITKKWQLNFFVHLTGLFKFHFKLWANNIRKLFRKKKQQIQFPYSTKVRLPKFLFQSNFYFPPEKKSKLNKENFSFMSNGKHKDMMLYLQSYTQNFNTNQRFESKEFNGRIVFISLVNYIKVNYKSKIKTCNHIHG